jgi:DNA-binding Xre family transcriptional regulator
MRFRHLDYNPQTPVESLGPAAIEALLDRGDLDDWAPLLRTVARAPRGPTAETVLRICDAHAMYGTADLWRAWIEGLRRDEDTPAETLARARLRAGLTQAEIGQRMGISQSDVSKLERRGDVRLSTLQAYARALGGRLRLSLELPNDATSRTLVLGEPDPHAR